MLDVTTSRERLLDAAEELLWERGVIGTSPRAVWDLSGLGQGSYYHHFPTKAALARAALDRIVQRSLDRALADLNGPGSALARLRTYLIRPRDGVKGCQIGRHANDHTVMAHEDLAEPIRRYFVELHAAVRIALATAEADGQTVPGDVDELADTLVATIQGGYVLARATGDQTHMDRAVRGLAHLLQAR